MLGHFHTSLRGVLRNALQAGERADRGGFAPRVVSEGAAGCLQDRISSVALTCQPAVDLCFQHALGDLSFFFLFLSLSCSGLAKGTRSAKKNMAFGKRF